MQDFIDLIFTSSPLHKPRLRRASKDSDLETMQTNNTICSPLTADPSLRNIVSWIVAGSDMNVHAFETVGNMIMGYITGKSTFAYIFERKTTLLEIASLLRLILTVPLMMPFCSNVCW
ncbi:hypothetical protein DPMN_084435 [Dreissena polymorpha]|uniref:Uncharacterized protein n=1 Tax=Dreissena polymorpha TaxID=45954 RepID=A0A9D4BKV6_DREPO|nr:hypothetical protein DPMN_084435 [Dreissena polymorpha]